MKHIWIIVTVLASVVLMNGCSKCSREEVPPPPAATEGPAEPAVTTPDPAVPPDVTDPNADPATPATPPTLPEDAD